MARIWPSMESRRQQRQQDLAGRSGLCPLLLFLLLLIAWNRGMAEDPVREVTPAATPTPSPTSSATPMASACHFALALPELEGPLTLGIFAPDGHLVRLLYRDTSIDSLPAGLNGLLITWDGNDDLGSPVPSGVYRARGLVHGKVAFTPLPLTGEGGLPISPTEKPSLVTDTNGSQSTATQEPQPLQLPQQPDGQPSLSNSITVKAAPDALLSNRPLLTISATVEGNQAVLSADGLPLLSIPFSPPLDPQTKPTVELHNGKGTGGAELILISSGVRTSYHISGLDQLVPLNAGDLPMPPQVFHPDDSATPDPGKPRS